MSSMWIMIVTCSAALMVASCGKRLSAANTRSESDPAAAAVLVDGELVSDTAGVTSYNWRVGRPNSQVMRASASSSIASSYAVFAPSSFDLDSEVRLQEGATIASQKRLKSLGIDPGVKILAAAPAVAITWTYDDETTMPYKLAMPVPAAAGLVGEGQLAVLFVRNVPQSDAYVMGIFSGSKVANDGQNVSVQVKGAGIYQAILLSAAVKEEGETSSDDPVETTGPTTAAPLAFQISGPTVEWSSAKPLVEWGDAKGAGYYEVMLDADDKACTNPGQSYTKVYATELVVDALKHGGHFVCVTAVNSAGRTVATNDGFAFAADKSPPATPAKPTHDGPVITTINVEFRWTEVDDVGPSGFSHYHLEIGTTPGGSDVFVGPIADELSKSIIGFDGKTYYARIKSVDLAGNESAWSANSAAVTVDSN